MMLGARQGKRDHSPQHVGVMVGEVVSLLEPLGEGVVLDATFGRGGHSRALLQQTRCRVLALDCDPDAVAYGLSSKDEVLARARDKERFSVVHGFFGDLSPLPRQRFDGVLFDLGVSSPQLDCPERGFSFQSDGPLDMRMAQQGKSAADWLNTASEKTLAQAFQDCGERRARGVARAVVAARPLRRTQEFASLLRAVLPSSKRRIDPATRCFMAVRIAVNSEQEQLSRGLAEGLDRLVRGGRMVVIAFHGGEDRIVKRHFAAQTKQPPQAYRHAPSSEDVERSSREPSHEPSCRLLTHGVWYPSAAEIADNPRARSARMRAVEKVR